MGVELVTYVLIGLSGTPLVFVVGFFLAKEHLRYLARHGGEEHYPGRIERVVKKYRSERFPDSERS